jgi:glycosyltransferase involved in cell wall biosynthesis
LNRPEKINLLVVPDLFPKFEGDVQGIFLLDYLACTKPFCDNSVLFVRAQGEPRGLEVNEEANARVYRYNVSDKRSRGVLKLFNYLRWLRAGLAVARGIPGAELVHAHGSILSGTLGWMIAKKRKIPFVLTEHVGPFSVVSKSWWRLRWTRFIMERADAVLCVSAHQRNEILASGIRPRHIEVTHNPVDTGLFLPDRQPAANRNILFAGRLDAFKGGLRCLHAFHEVASLDQEWTLTIVGDGEDKQPILEYLEKNPQLRARVVLRGTCSKNELAAEMCKAAFFVFPSRHESFGLVVAEALSCGIPVITTDRSAPPEFVSDKTGLLVDPDSVPQLAAAMQTLIREHGAYDPQLLRESIVSRFSFDNFGKKLLSIYTALLRKE